MNRILKFIDDFKSKHPNEIEDVFMNGYCYWFAMILSIRFKGNIWFNPLLVHFASNIGVYLYDISGMITDTYGWVSWEVYQRTNQEEALQIVKSIIKKE